MVAVRKDSMTMVVMKKDSMTMLPLLEDFLLLEMRAMSRGGPPHILADYRYRCTGLRNPSDAVNVKVRIRHSVRIGNHLV